MAHRFSLAPVLKLRESVEEWELHNLEQIQHEIAHVIKLLESLKSQKSSASLERERALTKGAWALDLHLHEHLKQGLQARQASLEKTLSDLRLRRLRQLDNYESAKRKRQVLSDLRDRKREAHRVNDARLQQRIADDSFLASSRQG